MGPCTAASSPARREPCKERGDSTNQVDSCGLVSTVTLTGPLGARALLVLADSVAAPMSSERMAGQYVACNGHSVSGVANSAACRISEPMYSASCSARRS